MNDTQKEKYLLDSLDRVKTALDKKQYQAAINIIEETKSKFDSAESTVEINSMMKGIVEFG